MRIMVLAHMPENPEDKQAGAAHQAQLQSYASPGTQIDFCFPDDYRGSKVSEDGWARNEVPYLHHALQIPAILRKIVWAEINGYDAAVQHNTFDPGVAAGRQAVRIPVIGVFQTSLHAAATLTDAIGVVVPLQSHIAYTWQIVRSYGMDGLVKDVQTIGMYGADLASRKGEIVARTVEVMRGMVDRVGVGCFLPLGGVLFPRLVTPSDLESEVGAPVLNLHAVGIRFAEMCVQLGLTHTSRTYPSARIRYEDFDAFTY